MRTQDRGREARWCFIVGGVLLAGAAIFPGQGCKADPEHSRQKTARSHAVSGACPAVIDSPTQNQVVGSTIDLRAHGDPACTNALIAYIDDVECTPSPPSRCRVTSGSDFSPYPNPVNVGPGSHRLLVNSWDTVGNVSVSDIVVFTAGSSGSSDSVLAGAGDIANGGAAQGDTARLLGNINPDYVFTLGDDVYGDTESDQGSFTGYMNWYDPTWGIAALKAKTLPNPGNHDFGNWDATQAGIDRVMSGYFTYFSGGDPRSPTPALAVGGPTWDTLHYGYDIPTSGAPWRFISIDSGPCFYDWSYCSLNGPEYSWLAGELAAHRKISAGGSYAGIVAVTHFNRWTSGGDGCGGGNDNIAPIFTLLYDNGVDLILEGHVHNYERFDRIARDPATTTQDTCGSPQGPVRDPNGPVVLNVGTGGWGGTDPFVGAYAASVVRIQSVGALKVTLRPAGFDFAFYSPSSWPSALDSGSFGLR